MPANVKSFIGRQPAWHKLGKVTGEFMAWLQILEEGGLDFTVFKSQLQDQLGRVVPAWGTFRWDKADVEANNPNGSVFLGTVGADYEVIQHSQGFEMIDALMQTATGAHYESAGVLGNGEVVWGLADLGLRVHVGKDESVPYLLFATSHDGSYSYQFRTCCERVVCQNTLNVALGERARASFKIRHTKSAQDRIRNAHDALAAFSGEVHTIEEKLNFLATRRVTKESLTTIMDRLFPKREKTDDGLEINQTRRDNMLAEILSLYDANNGNAFPEQRGTAYNLLNAVTEYTDHFRASRGEGTARAESALFGSGNTLKTSALSLILAEAEKNMPVIPQSVEVDWADVGLNVGQTVS